MQHSILWIWFLDQLVTFEYTNTKYIYSLFHNFVKDYKSIQHTWINWSPFTTSRWHPLGGLPAQGGISYSFTAPSPTAATAGRPAVVCTDAVLPGVTATAILFPTFVESEDIEVTEDYDFQMRNSPAQTSNINVVRIVIRKTKITVTKNSKLHNKLIYSYEKQVFLNCKMKSTKHLSLGLLFFKSEERYFK